jgi:hypothetical protein
MLLHGDAARALDLVNATGGSGEHPQVLALRSMIMHDRGELAERDNYLADLVTVGMSEAPYSPYLVAEAFAWIGDHDAAFEWIDRGLAVDDRYGVPGWWLRQILFMPMWQNLHGDPRWSTIRERVGMSAETMEAFEFESDMLP